MFPSATTVVFQAYTQRRRFSHRMSRDDDTILLHTSLSPTVLSALLVSIPSVLLSFCSSVLLSFCPSVLLSVCPSVRLSVCPSRSSVLSSSMQFRMCLSSYVRQISTLFLQSSGNVLVEIDYDSRDSCVPFVWLFLEYFCFVPRSGSRSGAGTRYGSVW